MIGQLHCRGAMYTWALGNFRENGPTNILCSYANVGRIIYSTGASNSFSSLIHSDVGAIGAWTHSPPLFSLITVILTFVVTLLNPRDWGCSKVHITPFSICKNSNDLHHHGIILIEVCIHCHVIKMIDCRSKRCYLSSNRPSLGQRAEWEREPSDIYVTLRRTSSTRSRFLLRSTSYAPAFSKYKQMKCSNLPKERHPYHPSSRAEGSRTYICLIFGVHVLEETRNPFTLLPLLISISFIKVTLVIIMLILDKCIVASLNQTTGTRNHKNYNVASPSL